MTRLGWDVTVVTDLDVIEYPGQVYDGLLDLGGDFLTSSHVYKVEMSARSSLFTGTYWCRRSRSTEIPRLKKFRFLPPVTPE